MAYVRSEDRTWPWPHAFPRKAMSWVLKFREPIVLNSGREIRSLMQARDCMVNCQPWIGGSLIGNVLRISFLRPRMNITVRRSKSHDKLLLSLRRQGLI